MAGGSLWQWFVCRAGFWEPLVTRIWGWQFQAAGSLGTQSPYVTRVLMKYCLILIKPL